MRAGPNEQPDSALHYAVSPFRDRDGGVVSGSGVGFGRVPLAKRAFDSTVAVRSSTIRFTQPLRLVRIFRGYGNGAQWLNLTDSRFRLEQ
jgi:hypothetical protein